MIKQCGADTFSYASDYPHEVDLVAAKQMIHDTVERPNLTPTQKKPRCWAGMLKDFLGFKKLHRVQIVQAIENGEGVTFSAFLLLR